MTSDESNLRRAAELLYTYGRNQALGDYKVSQMGAAGHWFGGALLGLLLTAILACAALLDHHDSRSVSSPSAIKPTAPLQVSPKGPGPSATIAP